MRVGECSFADTVLADQRANPRERHIQPHRFGELWGEQAELDFAGAARLRGKCERQNWSLRRMRFQIEMEQLDPKLPVVAG